MGLIKEQYASVGAAARHALPESHGVLDQAAARGLDVGDLADRTRPAYGQRRGVPRRLRGLRAGPTDGLDGVTLAPFQILAAEGRALALTESHAWHLAELATLAGDLITPTRHRFVDLVVGRGAGRGDRAGGSSSPPPGARAWSSSPPTSTGGRVQPGLKVRGREYLRIIYGPDYTDSLDVLREPQPRQEAPASRSASTASAWRR